jgi:hypothetical protein
VQERVLWYTISALLRRRHAGKRQQRKQRCVSPFATGILTASSLLYDIVLVVVIGGIGLSGGKGEPERRAVPWSFGGVERCWSWAGLRPVGDRHIQATWTAWLKGIAYFTARRYNEAIATLEFRRGKIF